MVFGVVGGTYGYVGGVGAISPSLPAIGEAFMEGYFAGVIDTTQDNIIAGDAYQTGARYALIMAPESLQHSSLQWRTLNADVPEAKTRWDGLSAQRALVGSIPPDFATFPAFEYCDGLSFPSDGGSEWYLPAIDEFEMAYRNLKPTTETNWVDSRADHTFPGGTQDIGYNPSSDPEAAPYTTAIPAQTPVVAFQNGNAQALNASSHWTATWFNSSTAWFQFGSNGRQARDSQRFTTTRVRPVRRMVL